MHDYLKIAAGILAPVVVHEIIIGQVNKNRCNRNYRAVLELMEANEALAAAVATSESRVEYLIRVLNENEIACDEFDAIVFNNLL